MDLYISVVIVKILSSCFLIDKIQSWKSEAGTEVQILELEFSLETDSPATHPSTPPPKKKEKNLTLSVPKN